MIDEFPRFIRALPELDVPLAGVSRPEAKANRTGSSSWRPGSAP